MRPQQVAKNDRSIKPVDGPDRPLGCWAEGTARLFVLRRLTRTRARAPGRADAARGDCRSARRAEDDAHFRHVAAPRHGERVISAAADV